jgi:hypothetical protein
MRAHLDPLRHRRSTRSLRALLAAARVEFTSEYAIVAVIVLIRGAAATGPTP